MIGLGQDVRNERIKDHKEVAEPEYGRCGVDLHVQVTH